MTGGAPHSGLSLLIFLALSRRAFAQSPDNRASAPELKKLSVEELKSLRVTSVSGSEHRIVEAPVAVSIVTGRDIRRTGAMILPETLRLVPGLHVARQTSGACAIGWRGFSSVDSEKLLVGSRDAEMALVGRNLQQRLHREFGPASTAGENERAVYVRVALGFLKRMRITSARHDRHAMRGFLATVALLALLLAPIVHAQDVSLEYQVKAVYLFNFVKFITWPSAPKSGPIRICVAERNPFGEALKEAIRGEIIGDRRLEAHLIRQPQPGCDVVFVPQGTDARPYLDAAGGSHTLTVGEEPGFLARGGIVNFMLDGGSVRFEIDAAAAERADLQISSHLMRLARTRARAGL